MPIYEYQCKKCGARLEVVQSFHDPPLRSHEGCGGELQKLFFPTGIIFKGSGFYSTDSRRKRDTGEKAEDKGKQHKGKQDEKTD